MTGFFNDTALYYFSFPGIFATAFLLALASAGILSLVLYYHWVRYSTGSISILSVAIFYTFGVAVFLMSMFAALQGI